MIFSYISFDEVICETDIHTHTGIRLGEKQFNFWGRKDGTFIIYTFSDPGTHANRMIPPIKL